MGSSRNEIRYRLTPRRSPVSRRARSLESAPPQLARITRLMALAIKLDSQAAASNAEVARLGHVSRSRLSQILNLRLLAPDIQERLLFLEPVARGREPIHERALRQVTRYVDWAEQRLALQRILARKKPE
jgi:hypothetical protein